MRGARNNVLAGGLVLAAIVATVIVVILLGGATEYIGQRSYRVEFSLADGVAGLERGSKVRIGGLNVGAVKTVQHELSPAGDIERAIVTIGIKNSITLRRDAVAYLQLPLLGSSGVLNFPSLGSGEALKDNELIQGRIAAPGILASAGYGDEEAQRLKNIMAKASSVADRFEKISAEVENSIVPDVKTVVSDVRANWTKENGWSSRVESITKNADEMVAKGPKLAADLEARLDQVKQTLETAQGYLDENRENVKATLANARSVTEKGDAFMNRLNNELVDSAKGFLEQGREAFAKGEEALGKLESFISEEKPGLRTTLANLRLSSDQLRDTLLEVRRSPWRLLYRPDKRELEYELLYDSARSYAGAVTELRAATDALNAVASLPEQDRAERRETIRRLIDEMEAAIKRVGGAEEAFLKELTKEQ